MRTAVFVSPHLDDAAFSCGGTLVKLAREGWHTVLVTIFTRSVLNPEGFALACQLDKNLPATIDYMRLRRAEDVEFARIAGVSEYFHLDILEAPHRGYESAAELFAGVKDGDDVWRGVVEKLKDFDGDLIFAPQGIGNHVDHLQTIRAILSLKTTAQIFWYRDTPYAIRQPEAAASDLLPKNLVEPATDITETIETKIAGCAAYKTQIEFQFGGAENLKTELRRFHQAEANRTNQKFTHAEIFLTNLS